MIQDLFAQYEESRDNLKAQPDCRFVEPSEFCRLLNSRRRMVRCDELSVGVRGVLDTETGVRFLVETERLFARPVSIW